MSEDFPLHAAGYRPGSLVAGYRLEAQVGVGGMAVVFRAHDERLDRLVALKILSPALASDPAFRRRFVAESRAAARVDDPHVLPVYEAADADGVLFIAMRLVQGGDLRLVLEREGVLSPGRAAEFISPVASALDAAHAAGLVHRDVKPANILVDARAGRPDHVYLSDFGIAKVAASAVTLTEPGILMGTPDYSAPEQIGGMAVDGRADQYALACLAYRLLTGAPPFERDQSMAVMIAHLHDPPPSLAARRPDLPRAADQVLARALAKAPDHRFGSCGDFADALREALGVFSYRPSGPAAGPPPPQHPPTLVVPAQAPPGPPDMPDTPGLPEMPSRPTPGLAPPGAPTATDARTLTGAAAGSAALAGTRRTARRRRPPRRMAVRVGLPTAVLAAAVALIVVAVTMHGGKPGTLSPAGQGGPPCGSVFTGYSGGPGGVTVSSIASAGGSRLAAGGSDGHPAIWRCGANGSWKLVSGAAVETLPGARNLTSVTRGPRGWIATGNAVSGPARHPVAVTSADGVTWQQAGGTTAFPGPGSCVSAVAAGPGGYVAVGKHVRGNRTYAAMWSSADTRRWAQGDNDNGGRMDGRLLPSAVYAVAATPAGFVAAGTHGAGGMIWTSTDGGQRWTITSGKEVPAGALALAAADRNGTVVVAGYTVTTGGAAVPIVVISKDSGQHWRPPITLGPAGSRGKVMALTATDTGFIAAGRIGPPTAERTVSWRSPDGLTWSKAAPAAGGARGTAALSAAGRQVTDATGQCAAPSYDRT